ncbi:MAG: hypothetical protein IPN63_13390 [Gammaproteobacteria bacterium]|jgi:predicted nucleic acid-binding protein|nr:hypothetical protein [Gammaproteobacteria bacterium]
MILVDANLLLYAVNRELPQRPGARAWVGGMLSGNESVGLLWIVLLAVLRLATSRRIFERPLTVEQANAYLDGWLSQAVVTNLPCWLAELLFS